MKEDDFTRIIIKPLFEALGYSWSQFNGGAYEEDQESDLLIKHLNNYFYRPLTLILNLLTNVHYSTVTK